MSRIFGINANLDFDNAQGTDVNAKVTAGGPTVLMLLQTMMAMKTN